MGYVGIPALIFIDITNYGRGTQTYEEKRIILHKLYSYLRGYLPVIYDNDKKIDEYREKLSPLLDEVADHIRTARQLYKPSFESIELCDPDEKDFQEVMDGIFERIIEIASISKVIDKEKLDVEEVVF